MPAGTPLLFVSYAHEDKELCRRLVLMLRLVLKARGYDVWWDETLVAGPWRDQIDEGLARAAAGLLFVSEYALTSEFVMQQEFPRLVARVLVAPVYGRPAPWRSVPEIARLQFLGSAEKALAELDEERGELAAALTAVAEQAPDFFGLVPIAPAATAQAGAGGAAHETTEAIVASERLGALHGVPELPPGYFERPTELARLRSQLLAAGSTTALSAGRGALGVDGAGGIGKTVLATALARDPAVRNSFPDGIYWVVLGERPDSVACQAALASLVGIGAGFRTVDDGLAALRRALGGRRALVVLDDVWSSADAEALLVTGTNGRTVLTTRHRLVLDRLRVPRMVLARLELAEARRFLSQATFQPEPLPEEADRLIEAVGGVVLALALMGATISHGTPWAAALAEVQRAGDTFRDESFANQFKAMQVAWGALDDDARRRYGELAVFGEDVTIPLVTVGRLWRRTAQLDQPDCDRLCAEFGRRNLLTAVDGGIRFHDMQRAFLQLQTPDSALAHRTLLAAHADVPADASRWGTLPDDEPYLWEHLVAHLVAAGDVRGLEDILVDSLWLIRRYHLHGPHAPEADLVLGLGALPGYRAGTRVLHRLRQVSHLVGAVTTLSDRALTFAHQMSDLIPVEALAELFPAVRLSPTSGFAEISEQLERVVTGHVGGVWSVAWSPDGRRLASGGVDGGIRIWDTDAAGRQSAVLVGHVGGVRCVAWSPDGRRVASGGDDATVRIWDAVTSGGSPAVSAATVLAGHEATVWTVAWSPDGRRLATGGSDAAVRFWDLDTAGAPGAEPALPGGHEPGGHEAGGHEAGGHEPGGHGAGGHGAGGHEAGGHGAGGHEATLWSAAWSPDGRRLATGGADHQVLVWDPGAPAAPPVVVGRHDGWASSVTWSPDGRRLASAGGQTVRVWDVDGTAAPVVLRGHEDVVWSVAWSRDGRRLVSGSSDRTVRVWNPDGPGEGVVFRGHEDHVWSVAWSPDSTRIASGAHDETVRVWEPDVPDQRRVGPAWRTRWVWSIGWSPDGALVATGAEDGSVRVWDLDRPEDPPRGPDLDGGVWAVAWSPDGVRLATGGADRIVRVWDATRWDAPPIGLCGHGGLVRSVAWSPDGRHLASVSDDGTVRVWEANTRQHSARQLTPPDCPMRSRSVAWSPDGRRLATGSDDGAVRLWDPDAAGAGGQGPRVLPGHRGRVESVAWSPDSSLIASAGFDGTVRVWMVSGDGEGDAEALAPEPLVLVGHGAPVNALSWSPDGRRLATGGDDRTVRVWDVTTAAPLCALGTGSIACSLAWRDRRLAVGLATRWTILTVDEVSTGHGEGP